MRKILLFFIFVSLQLSSFSQDSLITENGFILFYELPSLTFIPVKKMNINDPLSSFHSSNFKCAFYFHRHYWKGPIEFNRVKRFEQLGCEILQKLDTASRVAKVIPVRLTYKIDFYRRDNEDFINLNTDGGFVIVNKKKRSIMFKADLGENVTIKKIDYFDW